MTSISFMTLTIVALVVLVVWISEVASNHKEQWSLYVDHTARCDRFFRATGADLDRIGNEQRADRIHLTDLEERQTRHEATAVGFWNVVAVDLQTLIAHDKEEREAPPAPAPAPVPSPNVYALPPGHVLQAVRDMAPVQKRQLVQLMIETVLDPEPTPVLRDPDVRTNATRSVFHDFEPRPGPGPGCPVSLD